LPPWWVTVPLVAVPLAFVFAFESVPAMRAAKRKGRLAQLKLPFVPEHFRLDPWSDSEQDFANFDRADGEHRHIAEWLRHTSHPFLYLTGESGCGKSSIINAYLPRELGAGFTFVIVRALADPLEDARRQLLEAGGVWERPGRLVDDPTEELIRKASAHLRDNDRHLILVLDQFEEVFILPNPLPAPVEGMLRLLTALAANPPAGLTILLVLRNEYLSQILGLGLPSLTLGDTLRDVPAFTLPAGQAFLEAGGVPADDALGLGTQASELDQIPGRAKPITLNMLGLVYQRDPAKGAKLSQRSGVRRSILVEYFKARIRAGDWRDVAPRLLRCMITPSGARQPPATPAELGVATHMTAQVARGGLLRLQQEGIVREIAASRWEVSHDFLASQLNLVLEQIERTIWQQLKPWVRPVAALLWCIGIISSVLIIAELKLERLKSAFYQSKGELIADDSRQIFMTGPEVTPDAIRYLQHLDPPPESVIINNVMHCPAEAVIELGKVPSIRELHLAIGVEINDAALESLAKLPHLSTLSLFFPESHKFVQDHLAEFPSLETLHLTGKNIDNSLIESLTQLRSLRRLLLRVTLIDDAGLAKLHRMRPDLEIVSDNRHFLQGPRTKDNQPKVIKPEGKKLE
jgi:hypothetical protein